MTSHRCLAAAVFGSLGWACTVWAQNAAPDKDAVKVEAPARAADSKAADSRAAFLKEASIAVRTIDPTDEDFSDLLPLIEKIGSARVVLLGEQSHGDGSCFQGKSRLIKFLHQKMGFDVLAFESGMFDMKWVDEGMRNGAPLTEVHKRGLFGIWALSAQCQDILKYVLESNSTESPLELAGFDSQYSSAVAREEFPKAVKAFFGKAGDNVLPKEQMQAVNDLCAWLGAVGGPKADNPMPKDLMEKVLGAVKTIDEKKELLLRVHAPRDLVFMQKCLANQVEFARQLATPDPKDEKSHDSVRDTAMGENLAWLVTDYYAGRKVIVWAASMHNMYNAPEAQLLKSPVSYKDMATMGHVARKKIGGQMYSIMFIADHGRAGMAWAAPWTIGKAPAGSIDALMHEAGLQLAFIDLKAAAAKDGGAWLKEKQVARPLGYAPCEAVWTDQCDAFFFTDEMEPSTMR